MEPPEYCRSKSQIWFWCNRSVKLTTFWSEALSDRQPRQICKLNCIQLKWGSWRQIEKKFQAPDSEIRSIWSSRTRPIDGFWWYGTPIIILLSQLHALYDVIILISVRRKLQMSGGRLLTIWRSRRLQYYTIYQSRDRGDSNRLARSPNQPLIVRRHLELHRAINLITDSTEPWW